MIYTQKLHHAVQKTESVLCVGLDPDPARLPASIAAGNAPIPEKIYNFCKSVIHSTSDYCAAYKPNLGFFEALGAPGIHVFEELIRIIPADKIIVADAKRGDIGNTATQYKQAYFDHWRVDAVTLSPLMGFETITPFLTDEAHGVYVLTLTSNPGSADFFLKPFGEYPTLSSYIAENLAQLDERFSGAAGMVVGATQTAALVEILTRHPNAPLLIPGVGVQGGDIDLLFDILKSHAGIPLINVSRGILYGDDSDSPEFESGIRNRAASYKSQLKQITQLYLGDRQ